MSELRRHLVPQLTDVNYQHVPTEEPFRCTAHAVNSDSGESTFEHCGELPEEIQASLIKWLREAGVIADAPAAEPGTDASFEEEQMVLRRLTDLGYL